MPMAASAKRRPTFSLRRLLGAVTIAAIVLAGMAWLVRAGGSWWLGNAVSCSLNFWPVFARIAGAALGVALLATAFDRRVRRLRSLWMLTPAVLPMILLALGAVFRHTAHSPPSASWPMDVVEWFPWSFLPLGFVLMCCFRSISSWIIIAGITAAAFWLSLGAQLMSAMSVSNTWL
jgi:hypothetical protein